MSSENLFPSILPSHSSYLLQSNISRKFSSRFHQIFWHQIRCGYAKSVVSSFRGCSFSGVDLHPDCKDPLFPQIEVRTAHKCAYINALTLTACIYHFQLPGCREKVHRFNPRPNWRRNHRSCRGNTWTPSYRTDHV